MRTRSGGVVVALTVTTAAALSACSQSADTSETAAEPSAETVSMSPGGVTCAGDATAAPTPYSDKVPPDLPLPPGTVIYTVDDRGDTGVVLSGVVAQRLDAVRDFFNTSWPKAGYQLLEGETEELDAESNWENADFLGRWAIQDISGSCPGQTSIQVLSRPS